MALYDLGQVARILRIKGFGTRRIGAFRVDSRSVGRGDLFFALKGQNVDGHAYLADVAARGAVAAIVDRQYAGLDYGLALLRVVDVVEALQTLARFCIARHPAKVVAVTGSIGKTTTKDFLAGLLRQQYHVGASKGNSNSQIGLPLTILNDLGDQEEILVLEMGMTHPGNLAQLLSIAPADIAAITRIALVHAAQFDSMEHIARTKAEIFCHAKTQLGILHRDIPNFEEVCGYGSCPKLSFSVDHPEADFRLESDSEDIVVLAQGERHALGKFEVLGAHHRHNLLAAITIARSLGLEWHRIAQAMSLLQLPERRMQRIEVGGVVFINDSYNACEPSVKAALASMPTPRNNGRRIAILGSMPELGAFSDACHQQVGLFSLGKVDAMFCLGVECRPIFDLWNEKGLPIYLFTDRAELVNALRNFLKSDDVALVKGANTKKMWEILDEIAPSG